MPDINPTGYTEPEEFTATPEQRAAGEAAWAELSSSAVKRGGEIVKWFTSWGYLIMGGVATLALIYAYLIVPGTMPDSFVGVGGLIATWLLWRGIMNLRKEGVKRGNPK